MKNVIAEEIDALIEDRVKIAREQGKKITGFYENLKEIQWYATAEDIDIAMHSLKLLGQEIKERELHL